MTHHFLVEIYPLYTMAWTGMGLNERLHRMAERSLYRTADHIHHTFLAYLLGCQVHVLYPRSGRHLCVPVDTTGCGDKLVDGLVDLRAILLTTPEGVPATFPLQVLNLSNLEKFTHSLNDLSQILGDVHHPVALPLVLQNYDELRRKITSPQINIRFQSYGKLATVK